MGRKVNPPYIHQTTGDSYLDFFAAAVALAIKDIEHPSAARPHDAYSALAFLTGSWNWTEDRSRGRGRLISRTPLS